MPDAILIVDDHPLVREGLKSIIARDPRYRVTGEAGSCAEALAMIADLKPDLITLDVSLPDGSGLDLIRQALALAPGCRLIVVSMHAKIDFIAESFQAGASGYVVKESTGDRLLQALEAVTRGEQYLDSAMSSKVVRKLMEFSSRRAKTMDSSYASLTRREQQVMRLLAEGRSVSAIAGQLYISRKTVENHRANIMGKLGLESLVDLVRYAARLGLIDIDHLREESET